MDIQGNGKQAKRLDVGIASIAMVVSQLLTAQQSTKEIKEQIEALRQDLDYANIQLRDNYVQKREIQALNLNINSKFTRINIQLKHIRKEVKDMREIYAALYLEKGRDELAYELIEPQDLKCL